MNIQRCPRRVSRVSSRMAGDSRRCGAFQCVSAKHKGQKNLKSAQCGSESHHQHHPQAIDVNSETVPVAPRRAGGVEPEVLRAHLNERWEITLDERAAATRCEDQDPAAR